MSGREIRREPFIHAGKSYLIVVLDDGERLTGIAERSGKVLRASRVPLDPYVGRGFTPEEVDELIDVVKQWVTKNRRHGPGPWY